MLIVPFIAANVAANSAARSVGDASCSAASVTPGTAYFVVAAVVFAAMAVAVWLFALKDSRDGEEAAITIALGLIVALMEAIIWPVSVPLIAIGAVMYLTIRKVRAQ